MTILNEFHGPNAGYVAEQYERYRRDPASVDAASRDLFASWELGDGRSPVEAAVVAEAFAAPAAPAEVVALPGSGAELPAAGTAALAQGIRYFGHLGARLDPLGSPPPGDPQLELETYGLDEKLLRGLPAAVVGGPVGRALGDACEAIRRLRRIYCDTTGYEFAHVTTPAEREWLLWAVEAERHRPPSDPVDVTALLDRLTEVSAFERFLHRAYPAQTRFSVEGLGMLIPMLDELIDRAAETGVRSILLGMAHRGRLNVLAHVLGKPYERILAEFEGRGVVRRLTSLDRVDEGWTGDVKYHAGARRTYRPEDEPGTVAVQLVPNPSHLEAVDPVVQGMARAADEQRQRAGRPSRDEDASLAVLIHGDASFPGQGVVAETLNLSRLTGYSTGGTVHLIANNQLGFTTNPTEGRSTLYASDLAKGFEIPVVHVNADDPVACLAAIRLAMAYRAQFNKDVLVDLIGYRRWGHNEGDEPSFTQPRLYTAVREHPTVREHFATELVARGMVEPDEPERLLRAGLDEFQRLRESVLARAGGPSEDQEPVLPVTEQPTPDEPTPAALDLDALRELNAALFSLPEGFRLNSKLERSMQRRRAAFEQEDAAIDWGHAEALAFAAILRDGTPIRLTGQDVVRGTFSQRHLSFYDEATSAPHTPLEVLPAARASFEVVNSPLSENAALGFEYGYSIQASEALVLWEAQYGDFVNGAQVVIDEFIASGQAKWGLRSGLVMLLPHGWEGQGPDHSGGRLERFLQLGAEKNLRIANCSTAGQYFHLLRRQAASLRADPRPLVVMTPKSLLRHPLAMASTRDLLEPAFRPVLEDPRTAQPERVERLVLCSGKVWADVESHPRRAERQTVAVVRLEQLYPFPNDEIRGVVERYDRLREVVWLQEEPRNAGAWFYVEARLRDLLGGRLPVRYVGRPALASPAEGWSDVHAAEQRRIVEAILDEDLGAEQAASTSGTASGGR